MSEASSGIAHTITREMFSRVRDQAEAERIRSAKPTANTMVSPAVQAQKARDFASTVQKYGSERMPR